MRYLIIIFFTFSNFLYGQEMLSIGGVFENTLQIRIVPKTVDLYQKISNSKITIEVIPWKSNELPKKEDFINNPVKELKEANGIQLGLSKNDSSKFDTASIILHDGMLNSNDSMIQQMIFANSLVLMGYDKKLGQDLGLYYEIKVEWKSPNIGYKITMNGIDEILGFVSMETLPFIQFDSLKAIKDKSEITLEWKVQTLNKTFSSFNIYRSIDGRSYDKINKLPFFHMLTSDEKEDKPARFVDRDIDPGKTYFYKIEGIDHLGNQRGMSNVVKIQSANPILGQIFISDIRLIEEKLKVECTFRSDSNNLSRIHKSFLFVCDSIYGAYNQVNSIPYKGEVGNHFVKSNKLKSRGYLKICLVSESMDSLWSEPKYFFFRDSIPPKSPENLIGEVDSNGIVILRWSKVKDELLGYRIYRKNSVGEEIVEITDRLNQDTSFVDSISLQNLTNKIFYAVSAVDHNHNNSLLSKTIELIKPDLIPPSPSIFGPSLINQDGIGLTWVLSGSNDVSSVILQKRDSSGFRNVFETDKDTFYLDTEVENGRIYTYRLKTNDHSGNEGYSKEFHVTYELGFRTGIRKLSFDLNRESQIINLSWKNPSEIYAVYIYLGKDDGPIRLYKTLFQNKESFRFQKLPVNHVYRVQVQTMDAHGVLSVLSDVLEIDY
ncbi:MAG: hypothetical protein KDC84_15035 [Crocinitomicaceae bacterium]|nr:hypothetical protein [Crocinitomicaceae bacterium]